MFCVWACEDIFAVLLIGCVFRGSVFGAIVLLGCSGCGGCAVWGFSSCGFAWGTNVEVGCRRCRAIQGWFGVGCGVWGCVPAFAVASVYSIRVVGGGVFSGAIFVRETAPRYGNGGGVLIYSIS